MSSNSHAAPPPTSRPATHDLTCLDSWSTAAGQTHRHQRRHPTNCSPGSAPVTGRRSPRSTTPPRPRVFGLVRRLVVDPAQAEEVTQDVYLEIWQTAPRFDAARGSALAWMFTLAHRRAVDRIRAAQAARDRDLRIGARDLDVPVDTVAETGRGARRARTRPRGARRPLASCSASAWRSRTTTDSRSARSPSGSRFRWVR